MIVEQSVKAFKRDTKENLIIAADTVICAIGLTPNRNLAQTFCGLTPYWNICGDARYSEKIWQAVAGGYYCALEL